MSIVRQVFDDININKTMIMMMLMTSTFYFYWFSQQSLFSNWLRVVCGDVRFLRTVRKLCAIHMYNRAKRASIKKKSLLKIVGLNGSQPPLNCPRPSGKCRQSDDDTHLTTALTAHTDSVSQLSPGPVNYLL